MILGIGTDIIENHRIGEVYRRYGHRFLNRIFTEEEIQYAESHEDPVPYLAARFAVKEAAVKALNIQGGQGISWKDVEVVGKIFGKKQ
ncbi:MAG: holo-ACP synthase, partial [Leptospiraceae bacterium]|nr:holo-ACP synthase [Leptospiraceae bacterium]